MKLRSHKAQDKFAQVITVMSDKVIKEALRKEAVVVHAIGVATTRRELFMHLLS